MLPLWAVACGGGAEQAAEPPARPLVAVSVLPHAWLVERLAGGLVDVVVMIPPGASPATHEPDLAQRRALEHASLYVKVGHPHFPFEAAWLDRLLAERPGLPVVDGSLGLASLERDAHVWLSPARMEAVAGPLADALVAIVPGELDAIREHESSLRGELEATDRKLRGIFSGARGRTFLVVHPAWGALADDYELVQLALQHENREPDAHRLAETIGRARELGIEVIFAQPQFDAASARVVADEVGARVETLDPLAEDWATNLIHAAERIAAEARG